MTTAFKPLKTRQSSSSNEPWSKCEPKRAPQRPSTAGAGKKLQYALTCARLLAETKAKELALKQILMNTAPQPPTRTRPSASARCKSAGAVRSASSSVSTNQQEHVSSSRYHFTPVENKAISTQELEAALENLLLANNSVNQVELISALQQDTSVLAQHVTSSLDSYAIGKVVGTGTFGKVRIATHKLSTQVVAIKTYERRRTKDANQWKRIQYEARLMEKLDHPHIIRLFEAIESPTKLHIVMENITSDVGNLCEFVKLHKRLNENDAGRLFLQILSAVTYMHSLHLIHRDIKLENILLDNHGNTKLVDFGFSAQQTNKPFQTFCGTPCYMAPEIISRKTYWGPPVDVWSMGILLYAMLCGFFPFRARNYNDLYRKIAKGAFDIPSFLTSDAQNLLVGMLQGDPLKRMTLLDIKQHPWILHHTTPLRSQHQTLPLYRQMSLGLLPPKTFQAIQSCVLEAIGGLGIAVPLVREAICQKQYNGVSTLFYLLLCRAEVLCRVTQSNQPINTKRIIATQDSSPSLASAPLHLDSPGHEEEELSVELLDVLKELER